MPPKSKPKGLKASKRAAPFDPSTVESSDAPVASTSTGVELNKEQTMPLDEDCLTILDLFELRQSVLEILYPLPHSLALDPDPEKVDEARSFLRGILHGAAVLEPFVRQTVTFGEEDEDESSRSYDEVEKRRKDAGEDKLRALGLADYLAEGYLLALQTFALHHLGLLFEAPEEAVKGATLARAAGGGGKRRKIDVREPKTKEEWLAAAFARAKPLWKQLIQGPYGESDYDREVAYFHGEYAYAASSYAVELAALEKDEEAEQAVEGIFGGDDMLDEFGFGLMGDSGPATIEAGDALLAQLRARSAYVALLEAHSGVFENAEGELWTCARQFTALAAQLSGEEEPDQWSPSAFKEEAPLWSFLAALLAADAKAARFILLEDAVEAKYRPEDSSAEDEGDEEEQEVKPLPMDAAEVKEAKKAGEEAIEAVRATIKQHAELPKEVQRPEAKVQQYRKLEELLLVSSALINPDEKDRLAAVEKEIEEVRKEGGLDEEDEEEEAEGKAEEEAEEK
ncbi:hypothetical protein JCM10213_005208 [Rhodosporidiobolus nylandii]